MYDESIFEEIESWELSPSYELYQDDDVQAN